MGSCVLIMRRMLCHLLIWCFAVVSGDDKERYQVTSMVVYCLVEQCKSGVLYVWWTVVAT